MVMIQEDLIALRRFLGEMEPASEVRIGRFSCSQAELLSVVQQALAYRKSRVGVVLSPSSPPYPPRFPA